MHRSGSVLVLLALAMPAQAQQSTCYPGLGLPCEGSAGSRIGIGEPGAQPTPQAEPPQPQPPAQTAQPPAKPAKPARPARPQQQPLQSPAIDYHYVGPVSPPDDWLALRSEPSGKRGRRLMKMPEGTLFQKIGESGPWVQVRLIDGRVGWAHSGWIRCCITR